MCVKLRNTCILANTRGAWSFWGLIAGVFGAMILTRFLRALPFNVTATDPLVFMSIAALLAAVAPRVDPLVALREE